MKINDDSHAVISRVIVSGDDGRELWRAERLTHRIAHEARRADWLAEHHAQTG